MFVKILFMISMLMSSLTFAVMDNESESISNELTRNGDVQKCYFKSESGKLKTKAKAIINVKLAKDGTPTFVAAINNPDQTTDALLKKCIEDVIRQLRYPEQAKKRLEVQVQLYF